MKKELSCLTLLLSLICLVGCTHSVLPPFVPLETNQLPIIKSDHSLSVKILQTPAPEQFIVLQTGAHRHIVRTSDMNNLACTTLKDMLNKNNIRLADNATKTLDIAVVYADGFRIRYVYNTRVRIKAQIGGKITREFSGKDFSTRIAYSVSESINNALVDMLKDQEILRYLTE
jgi:hypothetical protein